MGTPHQGSQSADWANLMTGIASAAFLKPKKEFIRALKQNSRELEVISEDFRPLAERYSIVSFWEEDMLEGLGLVVVPKHSAVLGLPREDHSSLGGDHRSMVVFRSVEDTRFETVWRAIKKIIPGPASAGAESGGHGQPGTSGSGSSGGSGPGQQHVPFMVPFSRNERYIGKSQRQSRLKEALTRDKGGHRRLGLYGLGGIG
jgi:hypothetical protein